jgi:hypothetical protein
VEDEVRAVEDLIRADVGEAALPESLIEHFEARAAVNVPMVRENPRAIVAPGAGRVAPGETGDGGSITGQRGGHLGEAMVIVPEVHHVVLASVPARGGLIEEHRREAKLRAPRPWDLNGDDGAGLTHERLPCS